MTDDSLPRRKLTIAEILLAALMQLAAIGCLWLALKMWGDLIGYNHAGRMRFDLLSTDMKSAGATLALLYPVAAIGLWLRGSWGPVIWSAAAAIEIGMHELLPNVFGLDKTKMAMIASTAALYLVLRLVILIQNRRRTAASTPVRARL
jgi:uncharacterized membrane protein YqjE